MKYAVFGRRESDCSVQGLAVEKVPQVEHGDVLDGADGLAPGR